MEWTTRRFPPEHVSSLSVNPQCTLHVTPQLLEHSWHACSSHHPAPSFITSGVPRLNAPPHGQGVSPLANTPTPRTCPSAAYPCRMHARQVARPLRKAPSHRRPRRKTQRIIAPGSRPLSFPGFVRKSTGCLPADLPDVCFLPHLHSPKVHLPILPRFGPSCTPSLALYACHVSTSQYPPDKSFELHSHPCTSTQPTNCQPAPLPLQHGFTTADPGSMVPLRCRRRATQTPLCARPALPPCAPWSILPGLPGAPRAGSREEALLSPRNQARKKAN